MKNERTWNVIGMALGIAVILLGLIFCVTPAESSDTDYTDYASFGADFYTYQYDATCVAARNAAATASNVRYLSEKLAVYAGMAFVIAGLLIFLHYGKRIFCQESRMAAPVPAPQPMAVSVQEPAAPVQERMMPVQEPVYPVQQAPAVSESNEELEKYRELLELGVITQEEFDTVKARL